MGVARWTLAALAAVGACAWWWPGLMNWGAACMGIVIVWLLWTVAQVSSRRHVVSSHPFQLGILLLCGVLVYHLIAGRLHDAGGRQTGTGESIGISMITQLATLSLGMMLAQEVLGNAPRRRAPLAAVAIGLIVGPILALIYLSGLVNTVVTVEGFPLPYERVSELSGQALLLKQPLTLMGVAGAIAWAALAWSLGRPWPAMCSPQFNWNRVRIAWLLVPLAAIGVLGVMSPGPTLVALGICAACAGLAGMILARRVGARLIFGVVLLGVIVAGAARYGAPLLQMAKDHGALGQGEVALGWHFAGDSGAEILSAVTGWLGLAGFATILLAGSIEMLARARRLPRRQRIRAALWLSAGALMAAAMLSHGGLFLPAILLASAILWGAMPAMIARPMRRRNGLFLLVPMVTLLMVLGLFNGDTLVAWISKVFGGDDVALHALTGLLLAMVLAWLFGRGRIIGGLACIAVAVAIGGAGELAQKYGSTRGGQWHDFYAHTAGCVVAIFVYVLAAGSRWCESGDAKIVRKAI